MSARRWLRQRVVIVADRSRDLPSIVALVPEEDVFRFAHRVDRTGPSRVEAVDTGRQRSVPVHDEHLERTGYELSLHLAAQTMREAFGTSKQAGQERLSTSEARSISVT